MLPVDVAVLRYRQAGRQGRIERCSETRRGVYDIGSTLLYARRASVTLLGRQGSTCSGCWSAAACCWLTITLARLAEALDATELLRSVLEGAADRSVTVVSVGYMTNLLGLLQARVPPTVSASPELYALTLPLPPASTLLPLL